MGQIQNFAKEEANSMWAKFEAVSVKCMKPQWGGGSEKSLNHTPSSGISWHLAVKISIYKLSSAILELSPKESDAEKGGSR